MKLRHLLALALAPLCACTTLPEQQAQLVTPQRDYAAILPAFDAAVAQALFDPHVLQTSQWQDFRETLDEVAAMAHTDTEFAIGFEQAVAEARLFSHFELWTEDYPVAASEDSAQPVGLTSPATGVALLRVRSFDEPDLYATLDRHLSDVIAGDYATLIVDLRGNPGGNFAGWPVLDRLANQRVRIGQLVAAPWYAAHATAPMAEQIAAADLLTVPDGEAMFTGLMDDGLLAMGVEPRGEIFAGRVLVLVDAETKSTGEIVAAALQFNGIAEVVGTPTAGEVLNANPVPLAEGITLLLPIADFMLPDGSRIEGRGVAPDHATGDDALACALRLVEGASGCLHY